MSPDKLMEPMMIKKCHMILLALILSIQYDWANAGAPRTGGWQPNLVNSPSLPPYKDMIGGDPSAPVAAARPPPPPPYCTYPPSARPNIPAAPLPQPPTSPGAFPPAGRPPSIAPTVGPPTNASPASPGTFPPASAGPPPSNAPVAPGPTPQQQQGVWCVANPTVESADVQAAMDYACGSGADCDMAAPGGPCYLPATLMAHASYAFNSYWQRTKLAGGTCDFAGAAMLITKDPSYDDCRYVYT